MSRLRDLEAIEVSLVPRAANKRKFLILKHEEGGNESMITEEILKSILDTPIDNEAKMDEVLKQAKLSDKAMDAVKRALRILNAFKDEMPKNLMTMMANLGGYGMPEPSSKAKHPDKYEYPKPVRKADGTLDFEGVPEEVKPMLAALWKENEQMVKKSETFEKLLKAEQEERLNREFSAKANEYKNLSVKPEEFAQVLKAISQSAPDAYKHMESVLKAADEALDQSNLFNEIGSINRDFSTSGGAWSKIEKAAEAIMKSGDAKNRPEAITKAMEQNPSLYTEYLSEGRV